MVGEQTLGEFPPLFVFVRHKGLHGGVCMKKQKFLLLILRRHVFWDGFEVAYQSNQFLFHVL